MATIRGRASNRPGRACKPVTRSTHSSRGKHVRFKRKSLLDHLPIDSLRLHLLSFLPRDDICSASATCSKLYHLCSTPMLWPPNAPRQKIISRNKSRHLKQRRRLGQKWTDLVRRSAASSLREAVDWLRPRLRVEVNDVAMELMPIRRRQQQSERRGFGVHMPVQAHNLSSTDGGALVFDCSMLLKVGVEARAGVGEVRKVAVFCDRKEIVRWRCLDTFGSCDGEVEFLGGRSKSSSAVVLSCGRAPVNVMVNLHHADTLAALEMINVVQRPMMDDLNSKHGLEAYTCVATLRTFGSVLWQGVYSGIESANCCRSRGHHFIAVDERTERVSPMTQMKLSHQLAKDQIVGLYYRTACFSGVLLDVLIIDFAVWDDQGNVPLRFSTPIRLHQVLPAYGEDEAWEAEEEVTADASIRFKIAKLHEMEGEGDGLGLFHVRGLSWWMSEKMVEELYPRR